MHHSHLATKKPRHYLSRLNILRRLINEGILLRLVLQLILNILNPITDFISNLLRLISNAVFGIFDTITDFCPDLLCLASRLVLGIPSDGSDNFLPLTLKVFSSGFRTVFGTHNVLLWCCEFSQTKLQLLYDCFAKPLSTESHSYNEGEASKNPSVDIVCICRSIERRRIATLNITDRRN
jgi:hypothetical protein